MKKTVLLFALLITLGVLGNYESFSQDFAASFKAGVAEYRAGNYDKAVSVMDKIVQIENDNYYARYYLAISLVKLKKFREAKEQYIYILTNASDPDVVKYAKNGLKLLDPKYYDKMAKTNFSIIEPEKETATITPVEEEPVATDNLTHPSNATRTQLSPQQQQIISQVAAANKVDPEEINNLINILAKNPAALKTITKLAGGQSGNRNQPKMDPEQMAKLVRMMALNSQMGLLNSFNDNNDQNKRNNNDIMSLVPMMSGYNMNKNSGNNMEMLMNFFGNNQNNNQNNNEFSPDMLNQLFQQNAFPTDIGF